MERKQVKLAPLRMEHAAELWPTCDDDAMRAVWPRKWETQADMESQFRKLIDADDAEPFIVLADGEPVGSTSYYHQTSHAYSLGWTFYAPTVQRTNVNTDTKIWMLDEAFRRGIERVQFDVDGRNKASQNAVSRLGAAKEGTLRRHKRLHDGHIRDTVIYSILRDEWPKLRDRLTSQQAAFQ